MSPKPIQRVDVVNNILDEHAVGFVESYKNIFSTLDVKELQNRIFAYLIWTGSCSSETEIKQLYNFKRVGVWKTTLTNIICVG